MNPGGRGYWVRLERRVKAEGESGGLRAKG